MYAITTRNDDRVLHMETLATAKAKAAFLSRKYGRTFTVSRVGAPEVAAPLLNTPSMLSIYAQAGCELTNVTAEFE